MQQNRSAYYTSLADFAPHFQTGVPVLTYHKLGPRPTGARLKGLYVSLSLFARQLAELRGAGYHSLSLKKVCQIHQRPNRQIAITFDDGFCNVLQYGLAPLAQYQFHAIQFLVADRLGQANEWEQREGEASASLMDAAQVREWLAAGHEIGSHTLTHPFLTRLKLPAAREEIFASKKLLEDQFGLAIEHFCYPYGDWNEAVRDLVVEAGYQTACTTQWGVNDSTVSPFALKRLTARYRTRSLKTMMARVFGTRF